MKDLINTQAKSVTKLNNNFFVEIKSTMALVVRFTQAGKVMQEVRGIQAAKTFVDSIKGRRDTFVLSYHLFNSFSEALAFKNANA